MHIKRPLQQFILGLGLALAASAALAGDSPLERSFARGVYWPWEFTEGGAKTAGMEKWQFVDHMLGVIGKEMHCNVVWFVNGPEDPARVCDLAAKHGLLVLPTSPLMHYMVHGLPTEPELAQAVQAAVAPLREKKALGAYVLKDEARAVEVEQLETYRRALERADPTRPSIIVTMACADTEYYIARAGFPIVCMDIYYFGAPQCPSIPNPTPVSQGCYRGQVGALVKMGQPRGKISWVMPQAFAAPWGPSWLDEQGLLVLEPGCHLQLHMPTVAQMHWQTWEGVRLGCRGVVYFTLFGGDSEGWKPDKGPMPKSLQETMDFVKANKWPVVKERTRTGQPAALTLPGGKSTPQSLAMSEDFAFLERIDQTLLSLRPTHLRAVFGEGPAAVATFETAKDPSLRYAVVVNDDLDVKRTLALRFLPNVTAVKNLRDNAALTLTDEPTNDVGLRSAALALGPGEGTILQIEFRDGVPGLSLFYEDFSKAVTCVTLENAEQRRDVRMCALGSTWSIVPKADAPNKEGKIVLGNLQHKPAAASPLAGALGLAAMGKEDVLLYVEGHFPPADSLAVSFLDKDGKAAGKKTDNFHLPGRVPPETASLEFLLRGDTRVTAISLWRVPRAAPAKPAKPAP